MKQGLFLFFAFCAISNAYAQMDCESIPSCAELGYTQTSCPEGSSGVKCPFDATKFYCSSVKKLSDAAAPTVTPEGWTSKCADTIANCTALNSNCQCTACTSGYVVSNGNCVPECSKSAAICAKESKIFNAAACTCESCPTNYKFNATTKACDRVACNTAKVANCATYDSAYEPCSCTACQTNYLLVGGVCKKACTVVENCKTYDSTYDPCNCTACEDGFTLDNGKCLSPCAVKCKTAYPLFAGQDDTKAAVDQIGNEALAAYAASQFYVGDKDGDFGQGKWYLPSIGEWMYVYGTDVTQMTSGSGKSGFTGGNMTLINNALKTLALKKAEAMSLGNNATYWSSSEQAFANSWYLQHSSSSSFFSNTQRAFTNKDNPLDIRCFLLLKNYYNPSSGGTAPKIGDVIYLDKTYGAATNYDGSKTPVGVISSVSTDGRDVTIINLKNLTFSSRDAAGNFDPTTPYSKAIGITKWSTDSQRYVDITGIQNISEDQLLELAIASDNCPCQFYKPE